MSTPKIPKPAMVYLSILSGRWERFWPGLLDDLIGHLGPVAFQSEPMNFSHTSYYDEELGTPITRRILAFDRLVPHDELAEIKLFTNNLEDRLCRTDGRRICNLDPGLLTLERLVLATGKNYTHRIYLTSGIWADLTLVYIGGKWNTLPWTFPDYADEKMQKHLLFLRDMYKNKTLSPK